MFRYFLCRPGHQTYFGRACQYLYRSVEQRDELVVAEYSFPCLPKSEGSGAFPTVASPAVSGYCQRALLVQSLFSGKVSREFVWGPFGD